MVLYIIAIIFGTVFGNFATSFIHRIPLKKTLYGRRTHGGLPPHCASCNARLAVLEYLPIIGFVKTMGKCAHCGAKIPIIYPITELFGALAGVFCCFAFGINYLFILILLALVTIYSTVIILLLKFYKRFHYE